MRLFRHPRWQHLDYRVKVATTQENKPPTQGTRQWTFTTPRWRCGSILLPSLNAGVPEPTGGSQWETMLHCNMVSHWLSPYPGWSYIHNNRKSDLTLNVRGPSWLGLTRSISWLLMPWLLASPGHQQPWHWLCRIGGSLFYSRRNFNYLCLISVEE